MITTRPSMRSLHYKVKALADRYCQAQVQEKLRLIEEGPNALETPSNHRLFIEAFEIALNSLIPIHRMIIYNDYINGHYLFWWEIKFARSTYYRYKYQALLVFSSYF